MSKLHKPYQPPVTDEEPPSLASLPRWVVVLLLLSTSVTVLVASWSYLLSPGAPYGDDNSSHIGLMMQIAHLFRGGHTDLFMDQVNLGVPLFLSYQPLPGLLTGAWAAMVMCCQSPIWLYKCFVVGLWMLMPFAWYVGGRWLGLDRLAALAMGMLVLGIQAPIDVGLTFESIAHKGLFTQSFGILLLPLALGSWYRYLHLERGPWGTPVFWMALTFLSHAFFGMYAALGTACMLVVASEGIGKRMVRAVAMYMGVLACIAWWLVPLLQHRHLVGGLPWKTDAQNGWGWQQLGEAFIQRSYLDHGRFPWMSILALFGAWALWKRRDRFVLARWWVTFAFVTGILFLGRTNLGKYYDMIPLHREINVLRYLNGIHVCGLLLAALGVYHIGTLLFALAQAEWGPTKASMALGFALALGSGAYLHQTHQHIEGRLKVFDHHDPSFQRVVRRLAHDKRTRFVVGKRLGTDSHFHRDLLPALSRRAQLQSYGMSFHATYGTYFAEYFDYTRTAYGLYNVGHIVSKLEHPPIAMTGLRQVLRAPPYVIFETKAAQGYFSFVRVPLTIYGTHKETRLRLRSIIPTMYAQGALPRLASGKPEPADKLHSMAPSAHGFLEQRFKGQLTHIPVPRFLQQVLATSAQPEAQVHAQSHGMTDYRARVEVKGKPAWLLLRINFFPYWQATIDGEATEIAKVGPHFMAIQVPVGRHQVRFRYGNPWWQKWGFVGSVLALLGLLGWIIWPGTSRVWQLIKDWRQARRVPSVPPSVA